MRKKNVSRKFFWFTAVFAVSVMTFLWHERIVAAVNEARWGALLGIAALFVGVLVALRVIFKETVSASSSSEKQP